MASKTTKTSSPFFFIFDFFVMQGSSDENDVLPQAILYFYPTDEQIKAQKLLDCGEIVGVVQYFQHDLFRSIPRTLNFQKSVVAHEHYGRHSAFLSVPHERYTPEEAHVHLKNILNLFNILYGTWNHVHATFGRDNRMNGFLNQALTPIVHYVCNQVRSVPYLLSTVGYTPLKKGSQKVLLECKHCLDYLKSTYGVKNGLLGYDQKILYSSYDIDDNFYIQFLFQIRNQLPDDLICIPWESEFRLKNGVSLFRIYIPRPSRSTAAHSVTETVSTTDHVSLSVTTPKAITSPINIFDGSSSLRSRFSISDLSSSLTDRRRLGVLILADQSGSSEEAGFDTDTMDDLSSASAMDAISLSSLSNSELSADPYTQNPIEESLTDEQKLENLRSRSSTLSNDMEKTIELDHIGSATEGLDRIHITQIDAYEEDDVENIEEFQIIHRTFHPRTVTVTSNSDSKKVEFLKADRREVKVSWTNIPDRNQEQERDELVLYVQRNSRMVFAGVMEKSLLTDDYLKTLWTLMLSQMANMEAEIQVVSTANETMKLSADVKFQFNESTRNAEFERTFDGPRSYRKLPSEESAYLAFLARAELNRSPDRKVLGLSRGSHLISVDRRLPDRTIYSARRFQDSS